MFEYYDKSMTPAQFFETIDNDNLTQNEPVKSATHNYLVIKYIESKYGKEEWKDIISGSLMNHIIVNGLLDELIEFIHNDCEDFLQIVKDKAIHYIEHIKFKRSQ